MFVRGGRHVPGKVSTVHNYVRYETEKLDIYVVGGTSPPLCMVVYFPPFIDRCILIFCYSVILSTILLLTVADSLSRTRCILYMVTSIFLFKVRFAFFPSMVWHITNILSRVWRDNCDMSYLIWDIQLGNGTRVLRFLESCGRLARCNSK